MKRPSKFGGEGQVTDANHSLALSASESAALRDFHKVGGAHEVAMHDAGGPEIRGSGLFDGLEDTKPDLVVFEVDTSDEPRAPVAVRADAPNTSDRSDVMRSVPAILARSGSPQVCQPVVRGDTVDVIKDRRNVQKIEAVADCPNNPMDSHRNLGNSNFQVSGPVKRASPCPGETLIEVLGAGLGREMMGRPIPPMDDTGVGIYPEAFVEKRVGQVFDREISHSRSSSKVVSFSPVGASAASARDQEGAGVSPASASSTFTPLGDLTHAVVLRLAGGYPRIKVSGQLGGESRPLDDQQEGDR